MSCSLGCCGRICLLLSLACIGLLSAFWRVIITGNHDALEIYTEADASTAKTTIVEAIEMYCVTLLLSLLCLMPECRRWRVPRDKNPRKVSNSLDDSARKQIAPLRSNPTIQYVLPNPYASAKSIRAASSIMKDSVNYKHFEEDEESENSSLKEDPVMDEPTRSRILSNSLESKLDQLGITQYHWKLLLICALGQIADAAEIMGISFAILQSSGMLDDLDMDEGFAAHISSVLFLGMLIGGYLFGSLGDTLGRRQVLMVSMSVNFVAGFLSACVSNKWFLLCARFFSGVGAGGAIPLTFTYFIEFFGTRTRERWVIYLATFWCAGAAFVSVMGLMALPESRDFLIARWRVFFILISLPALLTALCVHFFTDPSPKFLLKVNDREKLSKLLNKMAGNELVEDEQDFGTEVSSLRGVNDGLCGDLDPLISPHEGITISARLKEAKDNLKALYTKEYLRNTVGLGMVWFSLSFSFYGWLTFQPTYAESTVGEGIYFESLLGAFAQLLGAVLTIFLISKLDAGLTIGVSCLLAGITMICYPIAGENLGVFSYYILWAIFSFVSVISWDALDISQTEAFKTDVRGTAFGFNAMIGRIGSMLGTEVFGVFESGSYLPIIICALFFLIAAIVSRIPESKKGKAIH